MPILLTLLQNTFEKRLTNLRKCNIVFTDRKNKQSKSVFMTNTVTKQFIKNIEVGSRESLLQNKGLKNQFLWELVQSNQIPVQITGIKEEYRADFSPCIDHPSLNKSQMAINAMKALVPETYTSQGLWDTERNIESKFLLANFDKNIDAEISQNINAKGVWLLPKPKLWLLPFEMSSALVASAIFAKAEKAGYIPPIKNIARRATETVEKWGCYWFESGVIFKGGINTSQFLLEYCWFLPAKFKEGDISSFSK